MRIATIIFILFVFKSQIKCQDSMHFSFMRPFIGTKMYLYGYGIGNRSANQTLSSINLGTDVCFSKKIKMTISYDFAVLLNGQSSELVNFTPISPFIFGKQTNFTTQVTWQPKHINYAIGQMWSIHENPLGFLFAGLIRRRRSLVYSISLPIGTNELEFQSVMQYYPVFKWLVDPTMYSISLRKYLGKNTYLKSSGKRHIEMQVFSGARTFIPQLDLKEGEVTPRLGISFAIGTQVFIPKIGISLGIERDWWVALNGGSPERELKGYVENTFAQISYHIGKKNQKFSVGAGYAWIVDNNSKYQTQRKILEGKVNTRLFYYNVRGIGAKFSTRVASSIGLDIRHIIPIQGENDFNISRTSLGIVYWLK